MNPADRRRQLSLTYDGPIPPAERAAARWGFGAWHRLARGADVASIEARLRACVAAMAHLRRAVFSGAATAGAMRRLGRAVAQYRSASLAAFVSRDFCVAS